MAKKKIDILSKNSNSILDSLQKKKTRKKDKFFLIPVVGIIVSICIFTLFIWRKNADEYVAPVAEPFSRTSTEEVSKKILDDDSFMLFVYADWCPFCKETMFGGSEFTDGNGTLKEWVTREKNDDSYEFEMLTYFERASEVENNGEQLNEFFRDMKDEKLVDSDGDNLSDRWRWDGRQITLTDKGIFNVANDAGSDTARPGVPAFIAINDGYVTGYFAGTLSLPNYNKFYQTFVVDTDNNFVNGELVNRP